MVKQTMKSFLLVVLFLFSVFSNASQEESCKYPLDPFAEKLVRMDLKIENLEKNAKCSSEWKTFTGNVNNVTLGLEEAKDEIKSLQEELKGLRGKNILPLVAFSANNPTTRNPGTGQTVIFAKVDMNEGNGFNSSNGKFTAPYAGFYQFSAHFCAINNQHMAFAIVYNGTEVARSTTSATTNPGCGSVNTLVKMATGEEVCVKGTYSSNGLIEDIHRRASFLGMLFHV